MEGLTQADFDTLVYTGPEVCRVTSLARPTLDKYVRSGLFPRPIKLGPFKASRVVWRVADVRDWLDARPEAGELLRTHDPRHCRIVHRLIHRLTPQETP